MYDSIRIGLAALLAVPVAVTGCAKPTDSGASDISYTSESLESGNIGQDNDASNPSTGDPDEDSDCATNEDGEVDDDSGEGSSSDDSSSVSTGTKRAVLQILWGDLTMVGNPTASTSWNGKLTASGGAKLKLVRTIRFEANDDAITGEADAEIGWTSSTRPSYDGVLVRVDLPANAAASSITFQTTPYTVTYAGDALAQLRAVTSVDTQGNAVSINALPVARCQHGFMRGTWRRLNDRGGMFRGQWIRANGKAKGFIEGIWGVRISGEQVFFGRIVSRDGKNRGRVFGHYEAGKFRGHWARNGKVRGVVRGHAVDANQDGRGFFAGEWLRFCSAYRRCETSVEASGSAAGAIADASNATDLAFEASGEVAVEVTCH